MSEETRIERIQRMEELFDKVSHMAKSVDDAINEYEPIKEDIKILEEYLSSGQWQEDYEADEKGQIPEKVKRGVLAQDGLYDLLEGWGRMTAKIKSLFPTDNTM